MASPAWGDYMGAWKALDMETERLTRAAAAQGAENLAKLKDLNVLIIGCTGVGVETAKNLILSNVGAVMVWDPAPTQLRDLGANFYLTEAHARAGAPRAESAIAELKSLNPFCKVDVWAHPVTAAAVAEHGNDVLGTKKPFTSIVVTRLLPKKQLFELNEYSRSHGIVFNMALNNGVTASVFSDFGSEHLITDADGEPTKTLALMGVEVLDKPSVLKIEGVEDGAAVVILTFAGDLGPADVADVTQLGADIVELDDNAGPLAQFNNQMFKVARVEFVSPKDAEVDITDGIFLQLLLDSTEKCCAHWGRQYDEHKAKFDAAAKEGTRFGKREITVKNRLALVLTATPGAVKGEYDCNPFDPAPFREYVAGGLVNPQKEVTKFVSQSLADSLERTQNPQMLQQSVGVQGAGIDIHLALAAVLDFHDETGAWPVIHSAADAAKVVEIAGKLSAGRKDAEGACWAQTFSWGFPMGEPRDLDEVRIGRYARLYSTELTGFCAYLGGVVAQEALKKTGKYTPIQGWIHHEDHALVADERPANIAPLGTRYDNQVMILGKDFQARCAEQNVFLVGCGALGCEYLKGIALMGVGVGKRGKVTVTDNDVIEISNLSRQFLFRSKDVGEFKSTSGAGVVRAWNPEVNVHAIQKFVGPNTDSPQNEEQYFTDGFWAGIDVCWNALDNVAARKYTDACCARFSKPLLESGTLSTKSNGDVFLPYRTKTYNDDVEVPETTIAMCTLKGSPYLPLHCIEYAKQFFFAEGFEFAPAQYEEFRIDPNQFYRSLDDMSSDIERYKSLKGVKFFVDAQAADGGVDFSQCIRIAFGQLMAYFRDDILAKQYAGDEAEKQGKPTWTGTKRRPQPLEWSTDNAHALEYLYAAANLYAFVFKLPYVKDRAEFEALIPALGLRQPAWTPGGAATADDDAEEETVDPELVAKLKAELRAVDVGALREGQEHDFEKDDDSNFHVDFLAIATNLRAWNFQIKATPRAEIKVIAGRILAALATTTAMVCGLVDIEFCKLVLGLQNLGSDKFLASNINLALGSNAFNAFTPDAPVVHESKLPSLPAFTVWDTIVVDEGDVSGATVAGALERRYAGLAVKELRVLGKSGQVTNKRVAREVKGLAEDGVPGIAINEGEDESGDKNVIHCRVAGPEGTPYEGGEYLVEVAMGVKFPDTAPVVTVVSPIYHMNVDNEGKPCPGLLFGSGWSPTMTIRTVLMQLVQLLRDPVPEVARRDDIAVLFTKDERGYVAAVKAHVAAKAKAAGAKFSAKKAAVAPVWTADDAADDGVPVSAKFLKSREGNFKEELKKKGKSGELPAWPHDYLILDGDFQDRATDEPVELPRIKLVFRHQADDDTALAAAQAEIAELKAQLAAAAAPAAAAVPGGAAVSAAVSDAVRAVVAGMKLVDAEDEPAKATAVAPLADDRRKLYAARYAAEAEAERVNLDDTQQLAPGSGCTVLSVTCESDDVGAFEHVVVVSGETGTAVTVTDKIMYDDVPITSIIEYRFGANGDWLISNIAESSLEMYRSAKFKSWKEIMMSGGGNCNATFGRMLRTGLITGMYDSEAFASPPAEKPDWQVLNASGKLVDIPRPVSAIRVWSSEAAGYVSLQAKMDGVPAPEEEATFWAATLDELRTKFGADVIDDHLAQAE